MIGDMGKYQRDLQAMIDDREQRTGNIGLRLGAMPMTADNRAERDRLRDKMNNLHEERHELRMRYLIRFDEAYP